MIEQVAAGSDFNGKIDGKWCGIYRAIDELMAR